MSVVCVDKASFPRDKTCGDGLTTGALRGLEALGLTYREFAAIDAAIVRETVLVAPSGRQVTLPLPTDGLHAAVIARRDLDAALVALGSAAGRRRARAVRGREAQLHGDESGGAFSRRHAARATRDCGRRSLVNGAARARTPTRHGSR